MKVYLVIMERDKSLYGFTHIENIVNNFIDYRNRNTFIYLSKDVDRGRYKALREINHTKELVPISFYFKDGEKIKIISNGFEKSMIRDFLGDMCSPIFRYANIMNVKYSDRIKPLLYNSLLSDNSADAFIHIFKNTLL